jgi:hypothetical protein
VTDYDALLDQLENPGHYAELPKPRDVAKAIRELLQSLADEAAEHDATLKDFYGAQSNVESLREGAQEAAALVADLKRQLAAAERELMEAYNHFAIQEGRIRDASTRAAEAEVVIENARAVATPTPNGEPLRERVLAVLSIAPSAALAERDAQKWTEGFVRADAIEYGYAPGEDSRERALELAAELNPYRQEANP